MIKLIEYHVKILCFICKMKIKIDLNTKIFNLILTAFFEINITNRSMTK